jgi:hypothetical protein
MFMVTEDTTKYPKCTTLIKSLGSTLKLKPKVLNAFLDVCKAEDQFKSTAAQVEKIAQKALQWATPPKVDVVQGLVKGVAGGKTFEGCGWNNSFRGKVFIQVTSIWFDAVEFGNPDERDKNTDRLTRTVLHELVHWVRGEAGASDDAMDGPLFQGGHRQEAGRLFEQWAFGVPSLCTDDELLDAIASQRK